MAYSQKSIQDAALREATLAGGDGNASPVIDSSVVLEDLFYLALREAVIEAANSEPGSQKRDYTIAVTSGSGTLPDTVVEELLDDSTIYSATESTIGELSSFQREYSDFIRPVHTILSYYTVLGSNFLFRQAGAATGAFTGSIHLVASGIPDIPGTITTPLTIKSSVAERTIAILANLLRGGANG